MRARNGTIVISVQLFSTWQRAPNRDEVRRQTPHGWQCDTCWRGRGQGHGVHQNVKPSNCMPQWKISAPKWFQQFCLDSQTKTPTMSFPQKTQRHFVHFRCVKMQWDKHVRKTECNDPHVWVTNENIAQIDDWRQDSFSLFSLFQVWSTHKMEQHSSSSLLCWHWLVSTHVALHHTWLDQGWLSNSAQVLVSDLCALLSCHKSSSSIPSVHLGLIPFAQCSPIFFHCLSFFDCHHAFDQRQVSLTAIMPLTNVKFDLTQAAL